MLDPSGNPAPFYASNPFAGVITPAFHRTFINAIDALLMDGALTSPCDLVFGNTRFTACVNCLNGTYKAGGPIPFPAGKICPLCVGQPCQPVLETECFSLMVIQDPKQWRLVSKTLAGPAIKTGYLETMCRIELTNKLRACEYIIPNKCDACINGAHFKRTGEPLFIGLGKPNYIIIGWERI